MRAGTSLSGDASCGFQRGEWPLFSTEVGVRSVRGDVKGLRSCGLDKPAKRCRHEPKDGDPVNTSSVHDLLSNLTSTPRVGTCIRHLH